MSSKMKYFFVTLNFTFWSNILELSTPSDQTSRLKLKELTAAITLIKIVKNESRITSTKMSINKKNKSVIRYKINSFLLLNVNIQMIQLFR